MDKQEIHDLIADTLPRIEAIKADALREIREAEKAAEASVTRHGEVSRELSQVEDRLDALRPEYEDLPRLHSRAVLDDDVDEELCLKERRQDIAREIEALERRRSELWDELEKLSPREPGDPTMATIHQYGRVASVAHVARQEIEPLVKAISGALTDTQNAVIQKHESHKAAVWQLGHDREWRERRGA